MDKEIAFHEKGRSPKVTIGDTEAVARGKPDNQEMSKSDIKKKLFVAIEEEYKAGADGRLFCNRVSYLLQEVRKEACFLGRSARYHFLRSVKSYFGVVPNIPNKQTRSSLGF